MIFNTQIQSINTKKKRLRQSSSIGGDLNNSNIIVELGQSNMSGQSGDISNPLFPFPDTNGLYWNGSTEVQLLSTRGSAGEGSHATYFADKYFELFGFKPIMVESASSSSAMSSYALASNWGEGSSLRTNALSKINSALSHYGDVSPKACLWCQGETDGKEYSKYPTRQDAKNALQDIVDWWFGQYPESVFLISQTGLHNTGSWVIGLTAIQEIQQEICNENTKVYMAFTGAKDFVVEGKMKDYIHYNYIGLKEMGEAFATSLYNITNTF